MQTMKLRIILTVVFLLIMAVGTTTHAAQHALSTSPFMIADDFVAVEYEWAKTRTSTQVLHVGYESSSDGSSLVAGYGTNVYLSDRVLDGLYFGTSGIIVTTSSNKPSDDDFDKLEISFNGRGGIKFNFDRILLDFALKFEVPMLTWSDSGTKLGVGRIRNKLGFGIGYAW